MSDQRPRWMHNVEDFELDTLNEDRIVNLTFRTDDDADHTFVLDRATLARLADEIALLQAS